MKSTRLYNRMFRYLWRYRIFIACSMLLSLLVVASEALSLWFSASLVETLFNPEESAMTRPDFNLANLNEILKYYTHRLIQQNNPLDSLKLVCAIMAASFLFKNIFLYLKTIVMSRLNLFVVRDMQNELYTHALKLPVTYYDRSKSGDIISLTLNDIASINASMTGTFDKLFIEPIRVIFFISALFIINVRLTLAVFIIFPILGFTIAYIGKAVRRRSKRVLEQMSGLVSILNETVHGVRAVKMFNMHNKESQKFIDKNSRYVHHSMRSVYISAISSPLTEVLGVVVVVILLWYGGSQVLTGGDFGADDFVRFLIFLFSTFTPLKALSKVNNVLQKGFAAAQRVFTVLDKDTEAVGTVTEDKQISFNNEICFKNVDFTYPGSEEQVLYNINFCMKKNSIIALVGSSGSGKTTILDLLPRFYDVTGGSISIDGKDIRDFDLSMLRELFGIVSQETVLFNDTIFNNIAYGLPDAADEEVLNAAKAANAMDFIEKLPKGMDTIIGERGVMLSGGQRQRLSIARALLKNPDILILDEATSALDTESERLVQSAINNLMQHRTALVVAHRLSTIQHADRILVLDNGKIVESGTHKELLGLDGRYRYLYDIQFADRSKTDDPKAAENIS
ncbi:ABC transporter ATP-binding protein [Chitinispirillales bacterium ANBcel5]|uniref:ABC transporter ATP-binding protein n=1 Tax=Cellulosispirillum alkaliphilum TaxID=3039283 RepID=UPI002A58284E|nr:ABC transporter ATP-binding protein [Chitinispirillales bacterium ANBcel5]